MHRGRGERGQILAVVALALVALLGVSAFAIDVGFAYYGKRQLQSATDAAALAGAQDLPNAGTAIATATSYATANTPSNLAFSFSYQTACTNTSILATGCSALVNPNMLTVTGSGSTNTWFARIFGITHFDLSAHANACSPCSSTPVDIVIAVDRTGSMCSPTDSSGNCIDLDNAKDGIRTMLTDLNPPYAQIGMVAFPPVQTTATSACGTPYNSLGGNGYDGYDTATRGYVTDIINSNYKTGNSLNTSSSLYLHTVDGNSTSCIEAGGNTSYSEALRQAKAELDAHGRPNVPDYIVFLTDGEANIGSVYGPSTAYPQGNSDDQQPCHTAVNLANTYKAAGVTIYSIGYALGSNVYCTSGDFRKKNLSGNWVSCTLPTAGCYHYAGNNNESPAITSYNTLSQIASPGNFYNQPSAGQLNTIFAAIATDIGQGSSRLVDDGF
ncbi:MAG TPA: vWA domain-containing protein [Gaiellales bacterium]|nr:vWA domain-containing protein [Gaiellales bacterium]